MGVFSLRQVLVNDEASFCENITDPGSATFATNIPVVEATLSLRQTREDDASFQARLGVKRPGHKGVRRATLTIKSYVPGHGTDPTGALSTTWLHTLIGDGLGGKKSDADGTTVSAAASASQFTLTAIDQWAAGYIGRVGTKGDGRGDGQPFVVGSVAGSVLTNLTALPAQPNNLDVVRGALLAYHVEGATLTTKRFMVLHATSTAQYILFGCQLAGIELETPIGGKPMVTLTYEAAYYERQATSFPVSTTLSSADCAPSAGGSVFINDVGTATRATIAPAEIALSISIGLSPQVSPGGSAHYQDVVGWVRTSLDVTMSVKIPWVSTYETWWDTENNTLTNKHILVALNAGNGRSIGWYLPNAFPMGDRPTLPENVNEQDYVTVGFRATEGTTTTNDLTRSSCRLFFS